MKKEMRVYFPVALPPVQAFLNAMTLDIAMGGSTNTVLHLLAVAHEAEADFKMDDIDMLSRKTPCLVQSSSEYTEVSYSGCKPCRWYHRYYG